MSEHDKIVRPVECHKVPDQGWGWDVPLAGVIAALAILSAVIAGLTYGMVSLKTEPEHGNPDAYKNGLKQHLNSIKDLVVCGPVYIAFFGQSNTCAHKDKADDTGPKATDWFLVIIGALQFWIYLRQTQILKRQAGISSRTLEFLSAQDRPYVLITGIYTNNYPVGGHPVRRHQTEEVVCFVNLGRSPATIHRIEFDGPLRQRMATIPEYRSVYELNSVLTGQDKPLRVGFPVHAPREGLGDPRFLYVRVHYADVYGRSWATAFAYKLHWSDGPTRIGGRAFNNDRQEDEEAESRRLRARLKALSRRLAQEVRIRILVIKMRWPF